MPLILDVLGDGPLAEKEIWGRIERGHTIVSRSLRKLVENGKVKKTGSGKRGDPYIYSLHSLLLSPLYVEESRRETFLAPEPAPDKAVFSPDDFSKSDVSQERIQGEKTGSAGAVQTINSQNKLPQNTGSNTVVTIETEVEK